MESLAFVKKIPKSKRISIHLPKFEPGQEVEVLLFVKPSLPATPSKPFNMAKWAEEWAGKFDDDSIRSDDVESFTGRRF